MTKSMCILQQDQYSLFCTCSALQLTQLQPLACKLTFLLLGAESPSTSCPRISPNLTLWSMLCAYVWPQTQLLIISAGSVVTSKPSAVFPGIHSCSAAPSLPHLSQHPSSCSPQTVFSSSSSRPNPPCPTTRPKAPQCPIRSTLHYLLHPSQPYFCFLSLAKLTSSMGIMPLYKTYPKPCFCL